MSLKISYFLTLLLFLGGPIHAEMEATGHSHEHASMSMVGMTGMYGSYPMSREASGTSWQPDSTPHEGLHYMAGPWMFMVHGFAFGIYDHQGGSRGDDKFFSSNMGMFMAQRSVGIGTLGFRSMLSLEPATIGKNGYPLLLQTGETANGRDPLIDRQHPHDLFMELAVSYSFPVTQGGSIFGYLGHPGEPALGPATYMHRFSGIDNPEAPITHHWLDSTHITFGVATFGYVWKQIKLEASSFTGREPDQYRWDFDKARFDSYSGRVSYNPGKDWTLQISQGYLKSPEQLEPDVNQRRTTASASYNKRSGMDDWQTTVAWGRNDDNPGPILDGYLLESALSINHQHTFFGRLEWVEKNGLFAEDDSRHDSVHQVGKGSLGYIFDFASGTWGQVGIGGLGSLYAIPSSLESAYGKNPVSYMVFLRAKLGQVADSHQTMKM